MNTASAWKMGLVIAPLLLAGCVAMSVSSDRYAQADFSSYRSYAWIAEDPLIRPRDAMSPVSALTVRRIREAIAAELAAKGYQAVAAPAGADFVVAFTVGTRDRIDPQSYPVQFRGPWRWSWYDRQPDLRVYREGTLAIDIFDGTARQPVWHGRARKEISAADISDPGLVIQRAVALILRKFPSRAPDPR